MRILQDKPNCLGERGFCCDLWHPILRHSKFLYEVKTLGNG